MPMKMSRGLAMVGAFTIALAGAGLAPRPAAQAATGYPNIVESSPLTTQYAHDFTNACVAGYYGQGGRSTLLGNHSESDLAVNPVTGNLLGASKFFFGTTADAGYSDLSPQYIFHLGSYSISPNGNGTNTIIPGYADGPGCQGAGDSTGQNWTSATDPNVAFASNGDAHTAVLPFTLYTNSQPNGAIYVNTWTAGAKGWGPPVLASPLYATNGTGQGPDKQWVATYLDHSTGTEYVNACWTVFTSWASQVYCSQSANGGASFWNARQPVQISVANLDGPFNTYVYPRYDAAGTLYVTYMAEKREPAIDSANPQAYQIGNTGVIYTVVSHDHGATFSPPVRGPAVTILPYQLPNTTFRDGISYYMNVSQNPATPGRLFVVTEDDTAGNANVYLYESKDGGQSWSATAAGSGLEVNDDLSSDQFQPAVTTDATGTVAVAWYDRRNACPDAAAEANTCIDTYVQFFQDSATGGALTLTRNGGNVRASAYTWDPRLPVAPAQPNCGDDLPRPEGNCHVSFIGDYFGAALGNGALYVLNVSTHNFGGNPNGDQQQVLQIVPIP